MGTIKRLPESVRNSMRSGIILFDLTRVVEELVFNSLDAGASKVWVYVGAGTCYVKVVDDGCGISRDGLVLLGQRYVTSKLHHFADMDAANESFGFRGEALASISDVSLLEIITKARGRPNGYRKVLKGSKCLYLGVNDDRKDVGTTVVVRDLFYNQPVRRKCMQSSLKKVLDSVKKCILRIAFVHSKVSFKVIDIESEDELLYTRPSSALSLLMSSFGIEDLNFFHELDVSNGVLKLSGYISGPCNSLTIKAFQYVYINSRFVCKGPIHKLLNHLATKFESLDPWKANSIPQKGKRCRPQVCPAYILNLSCPLALYDLTFEPSKTHVEFKEWIPILNFIENSVQYLWTGSMTYDLIENNEFARDKHEIKKHKPCNYLPSPQFKMLAQNDVADDYFLEDSTQRSSDHVENHILDLDWQNGSIELRSLEMDESSEKAVSMDYHKFDDELEVTKMNEKPFLRSCSSRGNLPLDGSLFSSEDGLEFPVDGFKTKRRRVCPDENFDILKLDGKNYRFNMLPGTSQQHATSSQKFSAHSLAVDMLADFDSLSGASAKSISFCGELCVEEKGFGSGSLVHMDTSGSSCQSLNSEWCSLTSEALFRASSWGIDHFLDDSGYEGIDIPGKNASHGRFADNQGRNGSCSHRVRSKCSNQDNLISSCTSAALDFKDYADTSSALDFDDCAVTNKDINTFFSQRCNAHDVLSLEHPNISLPETGCLPLRFHSRGHKSHHDYELRESHFKFQDQEQDNFPKERSRRSQSAPPFYKHKRRFVSLNHHSMIKEGNAHDIHISTETDVSKHLYFQPNYAEDLMFCIRSDVKNRQESMMGMKETKEGESLKYLQNTWVDDSPVEGLHLKEIHKSTDYGSKWQNGCQQIANNNTSSKIDYQHDILDISSGFLYFAGNSLVPESLHKNCLEDAKVLQQVDNKFIPIVANGTLAIIDQHAADERIRLEELRQKVLCGEARTVTYLDVEKELILPEIGYQLLQNYAAQIRDWGWICNIQAHSGSFKKNLNILHQEPTVVTLLAVPCILDVNLSDGDLLEFLQQLADTDGSSTMPQSVLRVLNFKACRGAIMFGDSLLRSECALIVEELKKTSLCFQCAHGRPTTVPLVDLVELQKQIVKVGVLDGGSGELWHGLRRQELSFERAAQRLRSARS
ncbi:DNA mismatch repair protein MLH3 isoform X2 [Ricinus communis]|uniref:DNA mismatch repair protein MLH3 isoform X2 n=1 Tax=Ricinus communis TaxID=3988 RepID=UPI00201AE5DA|nr:DNA mismatch repair protein MLH3 isoform X2 [Ricinus communis]